MQFLSPAWIQALSDAANSVPVDPALALALGVAVPDGPDGPVRYTMRFVGGKVVVDDSAPDVTFVVDAQTAAGLARGDANAQRALVGGRAKVLGNAGALREHATALATLTDLYGRVLEQTQFAP